ncbi:hypothetical protein Tco_0804012 [Tanacetum coccineum]|uniref:Uncharacterized protein n=1 Tax=Tanacetum coccineum TaxID=301880 RepID=A0ABQ5A367_9ASTR
MRASVSDVIIPLTSTLHITSIVLGHLVTNHLSPDHSDGTLKIISGLILRKLQRTLVLRIYLVSLSALTRGAAALSNEWGFCLLKRSNRVWIVTGGGFSPGTIRTVQYPLMCPGILRILVNSIRNLREAWLGSKREKKMMSIMELNLVSTQSSQVMILEPTAEYESAVSEENSAKGFTEILRVHGERTQGVVKTLMNTKTYLVHWERRQSLEASTSFWHLRKCHELSEPLQELEDKANVVGDALSRKERVKSRRINRWKEKEDEICLYLYGLEFRVILVGRSVMDEAHASRLRGKEWNYGVMIHSRFEMVDYLVVLARAAEGVKCMIACSLGRDWRRVFDWSDEKLQAARDCQKSYADSGRKMTEYEVGENVLLKVSPWKGVMRFGKKGKLAPRFVGPCRSKVLDLFSLL